VLFVLSNDDLVQYQSQMLSQQIEDLIDVLWSVGYDEARIGSTIAAISTEMVDSEIIEVGDGGSLVLRTHQGLTYPVGAEFGFWSSCSNPGTTPAELCDAPPPYTCPEILTPVCESGFGPNFCSYTCSQTSECVAEFQPTVEVSCTGLDEPFSCEIVNSLSCPESMTGVTTLVEGSVTPSLMHEIRCRLNPEKKYGVRASTQQVLKSMTAVVSGGSPNDDFPSPYNDLLIVIISARDDCSVREGHYVPDAADTLCRLTGDIDIENEPIPPHVLSLLTPDGSTDPSAVPEVNSHPLVSPSAIAASLIESTVSADRELFVLGIFGYPHRCFEGEESTAEALGISPICTPGDILDPLEIDSYRQRIEDMQISDASFCGKTAVACVRHQFVPQYGGRLFRFIQALGARGNLRSICGEEWFSGLDTWLGSSDSSRTPDTK